MRLVLVIVYSSVALSTFSQGYPYGSPYGSSQGTQKPTFPSDLWHEGKIVLESGDTLRGNLKYDLQNDILQFEKSNKLESFSARKVLYFEIFDKTVKRYRPFYSLPYAPSGGYKASVFFELLSEGKMTLLCREALEYRSSSNMYSYYYSGTSTRIVLVYKYFLLNENGTIDTFVPRKNDLLNKMGKKSDDVEKFIKSNKLKVDQKYDLAEVVNYYNSLYK